MEHIMEVIEMYFSYIIQIGVLFIDFTGAVILAVTTIKSIYGWIKGSDHMRLYLAQGIALALEFKMGGEVLRTVVVREWGELLILGVIIVLRGLLAILINWEIKNEEARLG